MFGHLTDQALDVTLAQERNFEGGLDFPSRGVPQRDSMITYCDEQFQLFGRKLGKALTHFSLGVDLQPCEIFRAFIKKVCETIERALVALSRINDKADGIIALRRGRKDLSMSVNLILQHLR